MSLTLTEPLSLTRKVYDFFSTRPVSIFRNLLIVASGRPLRNRDRRSYHSVARSFLRIVIHSADVCLQAYIRSRTHDGREERSGGATGRRIGGDHEAVAGYHADKKWIHKLLSRVWLPGCAFQPAGKAFHRLFHSKPKAFVLALPRVEFW